VTLQKTLSCRRSWPALVATWATLAMLQSRPAHAGCTRDVECKGVRVCEAGKCVNPPRNVGVPGPAGAAGTAPSSPAAASPEPATPPSGAPAAAPVHTATAAAELEQSAKQLFDSGRLAEAAAEYDRAYRANGEPIFLLNMGICYRLLGDLGRAIPLHQEYLRKAPESPYRPEVEAKIRKMQLDLAPAAGGSGSSGLGSAEAPPPTSGPVNATPKTMHFTKEQLAELKHAGAGLDAEDMEMAESLGQGGFTADEFVAAYGDYNAMKTAHPEFVPYGRDMVETIAVAHKMRLNESEKYWLVWDRHQRKLTLTQAYNERILGGSDAKTKGAITAGAGLLVLIAGWGLYSYGHAEEIPGGWWDPSTDTGRHSKWETYTGEAVAIAGGLVTAAGISWAIWGLYRRNAWLPDGTLDPPNASWIQSHLVAASDQRQSTVRWALSPAIGLHQAGLGLAAAF
jgi:tetratricopeptide (TPR) repeat protein